MKKGDKGNKKAPQQQPVGLFVEGMNEKNPGAGLFSNTVCTRDVGLSSREANYQYFEEERLEVTKEQSQPTEKILPQKILQNTWPIPFFIGLG